MVSAGLVLASRGTSWEIALGYGVFVGLLGIAAMERAALRVRKSLV
jgi:hypothetical protein